MSRRLLRLHARHDGERDGEHGGDWPSATDRRRRPSSSCRMVGAFFIDFTNAIIITFCLNALT